MLPIEEALSAAGGLLEVDGEHIAIIVVGGATLNLLGVVHRSTRDVDVIARAHRGPDGEFSLARAEPFPESLQRAIRTVARDLGLPANWMNGEVGAQWSQGLPPRILEGITWRVYGGLEVGLVSRHTLIALKLFAAVDGGTGSVHVQDLLALAPTDGELHEAAEWVATQDAHEGFTAMISRVIEHVQRRRS
ncbi:MAG TPA: hypothetical protein VGB92_04000 [Longimicrobium sp.]|jgi:hypothetical protein